jgi:hypothetical protein
MSDRDIKRESDRADRAEEKLKAAQVEIEYLRGILEKISHGVDENDYIIDYEGYDYWITQFAELAIEHKLHNEVQP